MQSSLQSNLYFEPPLGAFGARLKRALDTCPRRLGHPMTWGQLASELRKRTDADGNIPASYRSLMNYANGSARPRDSRFARHAADLLAVRWEWLHTGHAPMTNVQEAYATLTATRPAAIIGKGDDDAGPDATVERLRQIAHPIADFPAGVAAFADVYDRAARSSSVKLRPEQEYQIAEAIWAQIVAPLGMLRVDPKDAPLQYYVVVLGALMGAIPPAGQGCDLTKVTPTTRR